MYIHITIIDYYVDENVIFYCVNHNNSYSMSPRETNLFLIYISLFGYN